MDLANIIIISFVLFLLMLAPSFIKRAYHAKQCERLLKEYRDSCEQYNEVGLKEQETLPNNVIDLEEYRERRYEELL
jgi:hypothetical protein